MNRIIETLGYGLMASAMVGGSLHGLPRHANISVPAAIPTASDCLVAARLSGFPITTTAPHRP